MRSLLLVSIGLLAIASFAQVRTDTFDAAKVRPNTLQLSAMPDGGCAAIWCGDLTSNEGTVKLSECSSAWELDTPSLRSTYCGAITFGKAKLAPRFGFDGGI